jgi:hypothetical protein
MKRVILTVVAIAAVLLGGATWIVYRIGKGITVAVAHKSLKRSPGTVLSITSIASEDPALKNSPRYRICFSIDSSVELTDEERNEYQATLSKPFCQDIRDPAAAKLKPQDNLEVGFLLENEGRIDIARVETVHQIYP